MFLTGLQCSEPGAQWLSDVISELPVVTGALFDFLSPVVMGVLSSLLTTPTIVWGNISAP